MTDDDIDLKEIIKSNWTPLTIEPLKLSFKYRFESDSYELLIFDLNNFKLYHCKEEEQSIENNFNVNF
jgi:hypothetical protein